MPKTKPNTPETVTIRLFKDSDRYKDDVFVCVNGEALLIKRGETVTIPRKFADVLTRSMTQDGKAADLMDTQAAAYLRAASEV